MGSPLLFGFFPHNLLCGKSVGTAAFLHGGRFTVEIPRRRLGGVWAGIRIVVMLRPPMATEL
ncbi:MAG TPA: hypothetical protein EYQ31_15890 [Candidatus Handelsmanbacteria bacterium]|nr:hypothetical protein [Candidatus Handelsmanbacteria bacterium]